MNKETTSNQDTHKLFREAQLTAILFLLPAGLVFVIFVIVPIALSARYSTYDWNGLGPPTQFIGIENFVNLVKDSDFWRAFGNNVVVVIWSLLTQIPLGIALAILLTGRLKGSSVMRTLYFAPLVLSDVIVGLLWQWIYHPAFGLANSFLSAIGLSQYRLGWLGDDRIALLCVLIASTWRDLGFFVVIFTAAIQGIPKDLYEAAVVDGAGNWQTHRYITLPLLGNVIRTVVVLSVVNSLKFFDLVWVMTQGGPHHASEVMATYMYKQAFQVREMGYASAIAFAIFGIAFTLSLAFLAYSQTRIQFRWGENM